MDDHNPGFSPIIIFGGFLSYPGMYTEMRRALRDLSRRPVYVVRAYSYDWLAAITLAGNARLLRKLDQTVRQSVTNTDSGKITLIGHSQGGVLARLYLSAEPFLGHRFNGAQWIDRLVSLGSPHLNQGPLQRGGRIARYIEQHCSVDGLTAGVQITCVAGKLIRGSLLTSPQARTAYRRYEELCGDGAVWGDGLIPLPSALLPGTERVILEGVGHYSLVGEPWYGSPDVITRWWCAGSDPGVWQQAFRENENDGL